MNVVAFPSLLTKRVCAQWSSKVNHQTHILSSLPSLTMLKRHRPPSPPQIPAAYGDDLSSFPSPGTFHPGLNMSAPSTYAEPFFGISTKRPRLSPETIPGVPGVGGNDSAGRHTFFSSSILSKRRRSPDPMDDDSDYSEDDSDCRSGPQTSNTFSGYQREGDPSELSNSGPTANPKRRRTAAPVLEGSSRGWGPDQSSHIGTGPDNLSPSSYPHSYFDPTNPPPGWVLEAQIGEYAQENARLHNLHTLRPRQPHSEETTQGQHETSTVGVDMEEKVVKERYEEHNKYALIPSGL